MKSILVLILTFSSAIVNAHSQVDQNGMINSSVVISQINNDAEVLVWTSQDQYYSKKRSMEKACKDLFLKCSFNEKKIRNLIKVNIIINGSKNNISTFILSLK